MRLLLLLVLCNSSFALGPFFEKPYLKMDRVSSAWHFQKRFQRKDGWIGGDGVYSLPLPGNRIVWFFGDSFIGKIRKGARWIDKMVRNSIGIQDRKSKKVQFIWKSPFPRPEGFDEKKAAWVVPPDNRGWFWFFDGDILDNEISILAMQIIETKPGDAFGFKHVATWLLKFQDVDHSPDQWKLSTFKVPHGLFSKRRKISFGSAVVAVGEHLYIYGLHEYHHKKLMHKDILLARAPRNRVEDFNNWEFFSYGNWVKDYRKASTIQKYGADEFSVYYDSFTKKYQMVRSHNGLSKGIYVSESRLPEGPFSRERSVYECPEMKDSKRKFCYSAKAHPHVRSNKGILLSFCTNTYDLKTLVNEPKLYFPQFVFWKESEGLLTEYHGLGYW